MAAFSHIGVYLNGSLADDAALLAAGRLARIQTDGPVRVAVHVDLPEGAPLPDPAAIQTHLSQEIPPERLDSVACEVRSRSNLLETLRAARDEQYDLIVAGRRLPSEQLAAGAPFTRLARKSPCSVLLTPAGSRPHYGRIIVPVDLSSHSRRALEIGIGLAGRALSQPGQVIVQSTFSVGYGYTKTGRTLEQATAQLEQVTREKVEQFIAEIDPGNVAVSVVCTAAEDIPRAIYDVAAARKMDLVIIGSRGVGSPTTSLLGGTAEAIVAISAMPLLVVKHKGETRGLLDMLLGEGI